jgi:hypothetical protein
MRVMFGEKKRPMTPGLQRRLTTEQQRSGVLPYTPDAYVISLRKDGRQAKKVFLRQEMSESSFIPGKQAAAISLFRTLTLLKRKQEVAYRTRQT